MPAEKPTVAKQTNDLPLAQTANPDMPLPDWITAVRHSITPEAIADPTQTPAIQHQINQLENHLQLFQDQTEGEPLSEETALTADSLRQLITWLGEHHALSEDQTKEYLDMLPLAA